MCVCVCVSVCIIVISKISKIFISNLKFVKLSTNRGSASVNYDDFCQ